MVPAEIKTQEKKERQSAKAGSAKTLVNVMRRMSSKELSKVKPVAGGDASDTGLRGLLKKRGSAMDIAMEERGGGEADYTYMARGRKKKAVVHEPENPSSQESDSGSGSGGGSDGWKGSGGEGAGVTRSRPSFSGGEGAGVMRSRPSFGGGGGAGERRSRPSFRQATDKKVDAVSMAMYVQPPTSTQTQHHARLKR